MESNPKKEIHNTTGLSEETTKNSNKQFSFTLKGTWKRTTNKAQNKQRKRNNKDQSKNK